MSSATATRKSARTAAGPVSSPQGLSGHLDRARRGCDSRARGRGCRLTVRVITRPNAPPQRFLMPLFSTFAIYFIICGSRFSSCCRSVCVRKPKRMTSSPAPSRSAPARFRALRVVLLTTGHCRRHPSRLVHCFGEARLRHRCNPTLRAGILLTPFRNVRRPDESSRRAERSDTGFVESTATRPPANKGHAVFARLFLCFWLAALPRVPLRRRQVARR